MHRPISIYYLFILTPLLNCISYNEYYRLLDSAPYVDYCSDQTIPLPDKQLAFSLKGAMSMATVDSDTSIRLSIVGGGLHINFSRSIGMSFNGTSLFNNDHYFYGSIKARYWLHKKNLYFAPTVGLSAGSGAVGPLGDIRCTPALFITLKRPSYWYLAPRITLLSYPTRIEAGIIPIIDYELAAVWSISSGFNIKMWEKSSADHVYNIMFAPEISLSTTYEPDTGFYIKILCIAFYLSVVL
ncbi:hypothetical protein A2Y85_03690 [candidate division WOR-3 bacterium RBG_13_43_14]|uniref:Uncharacterized protein n=1 Tax=candidate division WOR-3 bacterium RBG_13_43_14 TaxID=1802590 RepID=A0A1F4U543_UNCW3|nr:MAG: hypothetical protein A2Y85_03690 [candidate division WOR-3 bacterium RBG_13_43_14]